MNPRYAVLSDAQWEQIAPSMTESAGELGWPVKDHHSLPKGSSTGTERASRDGTSQHISDLGYQALGFVEECPYVFCYAAGAAFSEYRGMPALGQSVAAGGRFCRPLG